MVFIKYSYETCVCPVSFWEGMSPLGTSLNESEALRNEGLFNSRAPNDRALTEDEGASVGGCMSELGGER